MTAPVWAVLLLGVAFGLGGGYPWGRWPGRRALDREYEAGYDAGRTDCYDDALADAADEAGMPYCEICGAWHHPDGHPERPCSKNVPGHGARGDPATQALPSLPAHRVGDPATARHNGNNGETAGHPDWRGRMAAELAPEALAQDVPRPTGELQDGHESGGPGHLCCIRCQRIDPGDPCQGCYCHDDYPDLADEIGAQAEQYLARRAWPEVGPPLLGPPSDWLAIRIERWKREMASIGEFARARELAAA